MQGWLTSRRTARTADLFAELMTGVLGYGRFLAHGDDFGASITEQLALRHAALLPAIHLTNVPPQHAQNTKPEGLSPVEQAYLRQSKAWAEKELRQAKALLESGALGRLLSARVYSSNAGWGPEMPKSYAYLDQAKSGANLVTILGGHTLDLAELLLGQIKPASALATTRFPQVRLLETGETIEREVADNLSVLAHHASGLALNAEIDSNRLPDSPFRLEIIGTQGALQLLGGDPHGFQGGRLHLQTALATQPVAPAVRGEVPDSAVNVAELYAQFALDIRDDTRTVPDFAHAARLTRLIEDILQAAARGERQSIA